MNCYVVFLSNCIVVCDGMMCSEVFQIFQILLV